MNPETVTLDTSVIAKLGNLDRELVFCDQDGRTLGYFSPAGVSRYLSPDDAPELYARARAETSLEELKELVNEPDAGTTEDVLRRLAGR